jgi:16S rRNA (cytidine1402-2'-O)-methyltransferase
VSRAGADETRGSGGGRLFVVATPIGNLGDVTLRALEVLGTVPLVAAEDTRLTRRLFARHSIDTPLTPFHVRNARSRAGDLLAHLRSGQDLALVTDAGTPGVSDPGDELAAAWGAEGGAVIPIPGPSAVLAALAASGIAGPRWSFEGFLPRSGRERRERLARLAADERGAVLFEAPGRMAATLADLARTCGHDRAGAVARELTKVHETIERGTLGQLARRAADGAIPARGEVTIVIGWGIGAAEGGEAAGDGGVAADRLQDARGRVEALVAGGLARGEAARRVAAETGVPRRRLYGAPPDR